MKSTTLPSTDAELSEERKPVQLSTDERRVWERSFLRQEWNPSLDDRIGGVQLVEAASRFLCDQ
jgi:hypothetical protein